MIRLSKKLSLYKEIIQLVMYFTVLFFLLQIMKSEIMRINHEQQAMKEKIKVTSISALLELKFRINLTFYVRSGIIIQTKINNAILFT